MKIDRYKCKAVVVGSGAGGAVAGTVLAEAGVDTIIVEEGAHYKKEDHAKTDVFTGFINMYESGGSTIGLGRPPVAVSLGRAVGGTTAVNSSTCFRPPRAKVDAWDGPDWATLEPVLDEVERRIHATVADEEILGGNWRVLKRGCDALGVEIRPLMHNILDCKGRGRCQFGCPEGAKQSTEVSFIPAAIEAGARLLASHRVDDVIVKEGRAVGVTGEGPEGRFEVRAPTVVLAMGALRGPAFLLKHKLANASKRVGKGLQLHPACRVVALFDEIVDGHRGLSQGMYVDKWAERGIMLEGIFIPPGFMVASLPGVGYEFKGLASLYRRLSAFGVMVNDTTAGRVLPGLWLSPFTILYQLSRADARSLRFGIARVAEIYLAAGARRVFTGFHPVPVVDGPEALARLESVPVKPVDMEIMAFHPVGTCPMGADSRTSVVDPSLETHDVRGLYIMDGSVIPDSLGVNPQVTIMALAMHAAKALAEKLVGGKRY